VSRDIEELVVSADREEGPERDAIEDQRRIRRLGTQGDE
jgi:hypothetical protein